MELERDKAYLACFAKNCPLPKAVWNKYNQQKLTIMNRCEDYSRWTIPGIFPRSTTESESEEKTGPLDSVGAQAVNSLSNKIVSALWPMHMPFMRLMVQDDLLEELRVSAADGDTDAQEVLDNVDKSLLLAEKRAMRELNYNHFRTEATTAVKSLLVTGNSLMYFPEDKKGTVQVYSFRDYVVNRDLSGVVIELLTRDKKAMSTLQPSVIKQLKESKDGKYKTDKDCDVVLYTHIKLSPEDGKYHLRQYADDVPLSSQGKWTAAELPWIVLTWNRLRGENYGRGLVEDYAGAFNGLHTLNGAFVDVVGTCADIKWLVNPASVVDVEELNNSESGSYHQGMPEDVQAIQVNKAVDLQVVQTQIQDWRQQIGQAFLLFTAVQRDAERVTAEEVRVLINELENQHGGIYSRFADEWQLPVAKLLLKKIKIKVDNQEVMPTIITGMDSLSRAGDMDNIRLWIQDLSLLREVPDVLQAVFSPLRFAKLTAIRRGVDYEAMLKTPDEMAAEQQANAQAQANMINQQATADTASAMATQSMQ